MASNSEAISVRSARLNQIVLGNEGTAKNAGVAECLSRESLLDALSVLYNECHKESQKNTDKQVVEFVNKCKFDALPYYETPQLIFPACTLHPPPLVDRPIMDETESLRVNYNDFTVKDLIGKGYFGEVHVS